MVLKSQVLKQQLGEQIALEEHLHKILEDQIAEIDGLAFADAREILVKTSEVLERHFAPPTEGSRTHGLPHPEAGAITRTNHPGLVSTGRAGAGLLLWVRHDSDCGRKIGSSLDCRG